MGVFNEVDIFFDCRFHLFFAVSVRYFIAKTCSDTDLSGCFFQSEEASFDLAVARVMIYYCSDAELYTVDICIESAVIIVFISEVSVESPPETVEDIQESVRIVAYYVHA